MAYWHINFRSRNNIYYQIRIHGKSGNTNSELTGGAQPIVTEEDYSDDVFKPVRLQTGYINIVDTGFDNNGNAFYWKDLLPVAVTDRPVELWAAAAGSTTVTTIVWQGYIRPQVFDSQYLESPQEHSLPVQCQLSALESYDFDVNAGYFYNFGGILSIIFNKVGAWHDFYFQGQDVAREVNSGWLYKRVSSEVFLTESEYDNSVQSNYNCLEVLQKICTFFGWALRTYGRDVYFCAAVDSVRASAGFSVLSIQDLDDISHNQYVQPSISDFSQRSISANSFRSSENEQRYIPGIRKVRINQQVELKNLIIELDFDKISEEMDRKISTLYTPQDGGISVATYGDKKWYTQRTLLTPQDAVEIGQDHYMKRYVFPESYLDIHFPANGVSYCYPERFDNQDVNEDKTNFNWENGLLMSRNMYYTSDESTFVKTILSSRNPYTLNDGMLVISGGCRTDVRSDGNTYNGHGRLTCVLKVGDYYYWGPNGGWQTTPGDFQFDCGGSEWDTGTGRINSNRELRSSFPSYDGYGIPIPSELSLSGIISLEVCNFFTMGSSVDWTLLTDLSLTFYRNTTAQFSKKNTNTYEMTASTEQQDEYTIEDIFTVNENNGLGSAILVNPDNSYCADLVYSSSGGWVLKSPGQHNAEIISTFMAHPKSVLSLAVDSEGLGRYYPDTIVSDIYSSAYWPMSINNYWRESVTRLTMIKIT